MRYELGMLQLTIVNIDTDEIFQAFKYIRRIWEKQHAIWHTPLFVATKKNKSLGQQNSRNETG
jgi:hypothetical protein